MFDPATKTQGGFRYQGRRKAAKISDEVRAAMARENRALINEFLERKEITVCKPGFAIGARPSEYEFL